jgi:hypothetical protein
MTEGWKDRFVKVFALSLIVVVFIGGLLVAWPAFRRGRSLRLQDAELAERMEMKRAEIAKLIENQNRFKTDPDFVEHISRQNRRVFPGELLFIFEDKKK